MACSGGDKVEARKLCGLAATTSMPEGKDSCGREASLLAWPLGLATGLVRTLGRVHSHATPVGASQGMAVCRCLSQGRVVGKPAAHLSREFPASLGPHWNPDVPKLSQALWHLVLKSGPFTRSARLDMFFPGVLLGLNTETHAWPCRRGPTAAGRFTPGRSAIKIGFSDLFF